MRAVFVHRFIDKREQIAASLAFKIVCDMLIFYDFSWKRTHTHTLSSVLRCVSVIAQRNNEVLKTRPKLTRVSLSCRTSLLPVFRWWSQIDRRRCERCVCVCVGEKRQHIRAHGRRNCQQLWRDLPKKTLSQHHSTASSTLPLRFNTWAPVTSRLTRTRVTKPDVSQHISLQDWAVREEERHRVLVRFTATERIMGNTHSTHLQQLHRNTCTQSESIQSYWHAISCFFSQIFTHAFSQEIINVSFCPLLW